MLFEIDKYGEFEGLEDFIEIVKSDRNFERALEIFVEDVKEYLKGKVELKADNIDDLLRELEEKEIELNLFEEQIRWIEDILENAKGYYRVYLDEETGNFIVEEAW